MSTATITPTRRFATREQWLQAAITMFRTEFATIGLDLPELAVSVGWTSGGRREKNVLGECWVRAAAEGGVNTVYISNRLTDPARVLDVLLHECVHAAQDCKTGHGPAFRKVATALGLEGKMTATVASTDLREWLEGMVRQVLGPYPHPAHRDGITVGGPSKPGVPGGNPGTGGSSRPPRQGTRMRKVVCPNDGYLVRTTRKWLDELGTPTCPCGTRMEEAA